MMIQRVDRVYILLLLLLAGCKEDIQLQVNGFEVDVISLDEGSGLTTQSLSIRVKGTVGKDIMASYRIEEGTAIAADDFIATTGSLEFSPDMEEAVADLQIVGDEYPELTESFLLLVTYEGNDYPLTINIEDDDDIEGILEDGDGYYTPDTYTSMRRIWQEEYDGTQLNPSHWTYEMGNGCSVGICGWGNNELESYTDALANCSVEDGKLTITALESVGSYTSARIKTQDKVEIQYGRIDVRAKLPKGQGIWPAIWMLGENITSVGWPACGEIDIMELVGHQPALVHGTVHYNNNGYMQSTGNSSLMSGDFSEKFHVFTILWDRNEINWYVDSKPFKTFTNANISSYPFNNPFFFILNVAVGGNWPGSPDGTTVFPQEMVVDYIRVFQ